MLFLFEPVLYIMVGYAAFSAVVCSAIFVIASAAVLILSAEIEVSEIDLSITSVTSVTC